MTFPLRINQLGYMNVSLQKFLGFNNSQICYNENKDRKLSKKTFCILRYGIKKNKNQSFLELLVDVYDFYKSNVVIVPSIENV